ncbi:hypothetical protein BB560_000087 [Smittium megazygosporum]|uniref:Cytochrome c oxidase subunit VIIc n=1 Tax=Smittium megazygosporum TaxID=133381 RepID=A0A2T9ZLI8_9FUNG|nr:hypothetical protein BB560_000087 [Smittium megazygosporum]
MIPAARSVMRRGILRQPLRNHDYPSPNGMNMPFDSSKKSFKTKYIVFCTTPVILTAVAYWYQLIYKGV